MTIVPFIDPDELAATLSGAALGWVALALVVGQLPVLTETLSTQGASTRRLAVGPLIALQSAIGFVKLAVPSTAARMAMIQGAGMQQGVAQNSAILRAQEMAQARDAYMQGTGQMRGMDAQTAQQQAALNMQAQGMNMQSNMANVSNQMNNRQWLAGLQQQYMGGVLGYDQAQMQAAQQAAALRQQAAQQAEASRNQMLGTILSTGGAILGGAIGGPPGAATGGAIGKGISTVGSPSSSLAARTA